MERIELREKENDVKGSMLEYLNEKVVGQEQAKEIMASSFTNLFNPLFDRQGTIGNYFFHGPSGIGKTELAKAMSSAVLGVAGGAIMVNCEQMQHAHEYAKLFGSPPGYIGYGDKPILHPDRLFAGYKIAKSRYKDGGNPLINRLPNFCVLVLDEFEKAHHSVKQSLLSMMDEGYVTLQSGKVVNMHNCIIIATSNIGQADYTNKIGFDRDQVQEKEEYTMKEIEKGLSPELRGRFDEFVPFKELTDEDNREVLKKQDKKLMDMVGEVMPNILVKVDPSVYDYCLDNYNKQAGVRGLIKFWSKNVQYKVGRVLDSERMGVVDGYNIIIDAIEEGGYIRFYLNSDGIIKNVKKQLEDNIGKKDKHDTGDGRGLTPIKDIIDEDSKKAIGDILMSILKK